MQIEALQVAPLVQHAVVFAVPVIFCGRRARDCLQIRPGVEPLSKVPQAELVPAQTAIVQGQRAHTVAMTQGQTTFMQDQEAPRQGPHWATPRRRCYHDGMLLVSQIVLGHVMQRVHWGLNWGLIHCLCGG